mgnify:CR=1 FL=1
MNKENKNELVETSIEKLETPNKEKNLKNVLTSLVNNELKETLLLKLKKILKIQNLKIDTKTAMLCLRYAMEVVELSQLKGTEQKTMALELIRTLLDESSINETKKNIIHSLLDENILESAVDIIVDATKGKLEINDIQQVAENCCWAFLQ